MSPIKPDRPSEPDVEEETITNLVCPRCHLEQTQWGARQGYLKAGETYCCRGCAVGPRCTCQEEPELPENPDED